ncbi:MAG TPA: ribosome maturation factor RimM [Solirubrobacteraceae bacterium]|jgi:16S rRNA processing protein RimM|nr:ribosome maturation factor RimM [Solirubrobacteraceae bacterium]
MVLAGLVGKPHGLDGSFYVSQANAALLGLGVALTVSGSQRAIVRRAGTDARPIIRIEGCEDRAGAQALQGSRLEVPAAERPALGEDEWWAEELEGARVFDGEVELGVVRRLLALPSCECLEVERATGGADLLVPLVRDAIRAVDIAAARIDIDLAFLGEEP